MPNQTCGPYILWVSYGTENWCPRCFDNLEDALSCIQEGVGEPWVLTKRLTIMVTEVDETTP